MEKTFSYSEGEYGHRVRIHRRPGRRNFYISFWSDGKTATASLKHSDEEKARGQCRDLSDALRLGLSIADLLNEDGDENEPQATESASEVRATDRSEAVDTDASRGVWQDLFERYHEARGRHKKGSGPKEDLRRQKIWRAYLGKRKIDQPIELDQDDINDFSRIRIKGLLEVPGVALKSANVDRPGENVVAPRTVAADIIYLQTVLNWAAVKRVDDRPLLERKLAISVPPNLKTRRPRRPVATHEDLRDLLGSADIADPTGLFRCFLHAHDELGWRVTGVCHTRAEELDFTPRPGMPYGSVRKNPHVDKEGVGQQVPLTKRSRAAFKRALKLRSLKAGAKAYIFAAPKNKRKPWSRWRVRDLTNRAEKTAGIEHIGGSHAVRRKWVTERKDYPIPDIMEAGGWVDPRSLEAYMHSDPDTTYQVVSRRTRRIRRTTTQAVA